jgi:hypothetical protein
LAWAAGRLGARASRATRTPDSDSGFELRGPRAESRERGGPVSCELLATGDRRACCVMRAGHCVLRAGHCGEP